MASVAGTLNEKFQQLDINSENTGKSAERRDYDPGWLKGTSADQRPKTTCNRTAPSVRSDFSDPVYKKLSRINGKINSMPVHALVCSLRELNLETG